MRPGKAFSYSFDKWWRPILFFSATAAIFLLSWLSKNIIFENISFILLGFGLLGLLASAIYQFGRRHWLEGIVTLLVFGGTIAAFIIYAVLSFVIETIDGDKWADNLTIPDNITLNVPLGNGSPVRPDSVILSPWTAPRFELYHSFQPGLYEYDYWTREIEKGTIYLKAYEITQEYALSTHQLPEQSAVKVNNPSNDIMLFGTTKAFTIYEGDWGKPYAARFELWFKPDNGGEEKKLLEKNYRIEGWQR